MRIMKLLVLCLAFSTSSFAAPPNATQMGNMWFCNEGYKKVGDSCERLLVPENAYVIGNMWACNEGYKKVGSSCERLSVPENAYVIGNMWACNEGYKKVGSSCKRLSVPKNAYVIGNMWACNEGYKKVSNRCREMSSQELENRAQLLELAAQRQADLRANGVSGQSCDTEYETGAEVCLSVGMTSMDCDESYDDTHYESCSIDIDYSLETYYKGGSQISVGVYCEAEISYESMVSRNRYDNDSEHESHYLSSFDYVSGYVDINFDFSSYEEVYSVSLDSAWCELRGVNLY